MSTFAYDQHEVDEEAGTPTSPFPKAMLSIGEEAKKKFSQWLFEQLESSLTSHDELVEKWAQETIDYRALPEQPKSKPFIGACNEVIPVVAMSVDPIHARLDTGIFKNDQIMRIKPLDKRLKNYTASVEKFVEYYWRHYLSMRRVASPNLFQCAKHGHCVFRVEYEDDTQIVKTYQQDKSGWKAIQRTMTKCKGPKISAVSIQNFIYPPRYQYLQDAPVVFERVWMHKSEIDAEVKRGRLVSTDKIAESDGGSRGVLDDALEDTAQHHETNRDSGWFECFRFAGRYDIDDNGFQESLIGICHRDSQGLLQLRYNWYFHQRYPYVVIPYSVSDNSIGGVGLCEMIGPFQKSVTSWHQHIWNNGYLANSRLIVRKKEGVVTEDATSWYSGKEIYVDDPDKDFRVMAMSDTYNSGPQMLNTLMSFVEKRTGVSDYLTGRESPIVGSRATATSTVALIQEGTKRVEETLENLRYGFAEMLEMCFYIWIQYGTDGMEYKVFDKETADNIRAFFDAATELDIGASIRVELAATDASNNKTVQQQLQLSLIQTFTMYYDKLIQGAQLAVQASAQSPILAKLVGQVMEDATKLYHDLAVKYDVPSPEDYLPDLTEFNASLSQGPAPVAGAASPNGAGGPSPMQGMEGGGGGNVGPAGSMPQAGGVSNGAGAGIPAFA